MGNNMCCRAYFALALALSLIASLSTAQTVLPSLRRPSEQTLPLPDYQPAPPPVTAPPSALPAPPPMATPAFPDERILVRRFAISGNTAFSTAELAQITAPYENRSLSAEELQEVRQQLTLYYIERGYLNSGAILPEQDLREGIVRIEIVEGRLIGIEVDGNTGLRREVIEARLAPLLSGPLQLQRVQEYMQLLQQNPLIKQLQVEIAPAPRPGQAILRVVVREETPYQVVLNLDNDSPPSVGGEQAQLYLAHLNVSGWGDSLGIRTALTEASDEYVLVYQRPLNAAGTTLLSLTADVSDSEVIEAPFDALDIESEQVSYALGLTHILHQTSRRTVSTGLSLERRHNETTLLGEPFSFSPGAEDGKSTVAVARFFQQWIERDVNEVMAARSTFSFGFDGWGSTVHHDAPDSQFMAWLGQFQWARRFGERGNQLLFRTDMQFSDSALLPMEKFAVGGADTVRGYRKNALVRDNAIVASLESRFPLFRLSLPGVSKADDEGIVQLALFGDYGRSWNKSEIDVGPKDIYSVGLGLRWDPSPAIHAQVYYGKALRELEQREDDLQDRGITFQVQVAYPFLR